LPQVVVVVRRGQGTVPARRVAGGFSCGRPCICSHDTGSSAGSVLHGQTIASGVYLRDTQNLSSSCEVSLLVCLRLWLSDSIGGRVDQEVTHPGPSQSRTCPTQASGSSEPQVCYVPTVVGTIFTRGSGYCSKRRAKRSQCLRRRWERRFSHVRQRRMTSHRTRRSRCSLPVIP
jgi:hypothetical protein